MGFVDRMERPAKPRGVSNALALGGLAALLLAAVRFATDRSPATLRPAEMEAGTPLSQIDHDGDLLPDSAEWVLFSDPAKKDSDLDGADDFIEALDATDPNVKDGKRSAKDSFRILLSTIRDNRTAGVRRLYVHLLFRIASGRFKDLKGLTLFLKVGNKQFSGDSLIWRNLESVFTRTDPKQGLLICMNIMVPVNDTLGNFGPITFGGYSWIGSVIHKAANVLIHRGGVFHTISVIPSHTLIMQSTGPDEIANPFWSKNKACVFTLDVQAIGRGGVLCEVKDAACEIATRLRCTSSCRNMKGLTFFLPDGLGLITGG